MVSLKVEPSFDGLRNDPLTLWGFWQEFRGLRYSFWGLFGWFSILLPNSVYTLLDGVTLLALAGLAFLIIFGKYILPDREPPSTQVTRSSDELTKIYQLPERLWEAEVIAGSAITNKSLKESHIGELLGVAILGIRRGRRARA